MSEELEQDDRPDSPHVIVVLDEHGRAAMYTAPANVSDFLTRGLGGPSWIAEGTKDVPALLDTARQIAEARRKGVPLAAPTHESLADPKILANLRQRFSFRVKPSEDGS